MHDDRDAPEGRKPETFHATHIYRNLGATCLVVAVQFAGLARWDDRGPLNDPPPDQLLGNILFVVGIDSSFVAVGVFFLVAHRRWAVVLGRDAVRIRGVFRDRSFRCEDIREAQWPAGLRGRRYPLSLRTEWESAEIDLYLSYEDTGRLIALLRRRLPEAIQRGWDRFATFEGRDDRGEPLELPGPDVPIDPAVARRNRAGRDRLFPWVAIASALTLAACMPFFGSHRHLVAAPSIASLIAPLAWPRPSSFGPTDSRAWLLANGAGVARWVLRVAGAIAEVVLLKLGLVGLFFCLMVIWAKVTWWSLVRLDLPIDDPLAAIVVGEVLAAATMAAGALPIARRLDPRRKRERDAESARRATLRRERAAGRDGSRPDGYDERTIPDGADGA